MSGQYASYWNAYLCNVLAHYKKTGALQKTGGCITKKWVQNKKWVPVTSACSPKPKTRTIANSGLVPSAPVDTTRCPYWVYLAEKSIPPPKWQVPCSLRHIHQRSPKRPGTRHTQPFHRKEPVWHIHYPKGPLPRLAHPLPLDRMTHTFSASCRASVTCGFCCVWISYSREGVA